MKKKKIDLALSFFILLLLTSCSGLHHSINAYNADVKIEKDAVALLSKVDESYTSHATEVDALKKEIADAITYEKSRKCNKATLSMFNEVTNPNTAGSLYQLLDIWKNNGTLSADMAPQASRQAHRLISSITDLENHKIKK